MNKYFAFISYSREDEAWAMWFQHEMENYHLPETLEDRSDLPEMFSPIFRDVDELKAGNLPEQIHNALASTSYLVVICSRNSAKSEWVNKEIIDFIEIGNNKGVNNVKNIFPFIVEGQPHAKDKTKECFPTALLSLKNIEEQIGGNVNEGGRDMAFVKVLAGMLPGVGFSALWNRYERNKAEEERKKREEREKFLRIQSRFIAKEAINISHDSSLAQLIALEVLPKNMQAPERPLTIEAERALRQSVFHHHLTLGGDQVLRVKNVCFSSDGKQIASISDTIRVWDAETGLLVRMIGAGFYPLGSCLAYIHRDKWLISVFRDGAIIWDVETGVQITNIDCGIEHPACINSMAVRHDIDQFALATSEGDVVLCDITTKDIRSFHIESSVYSVAFSPDGGMVALLTEDGLVVRDLQKNTDRIWKLERKSTVGSSSEEVLDSTYAYATFSPDVKKIAFIVDGAIGLVNLDDGRIDLEEEQCCAAIAFCNGGANIATISILGESIIWDIIDTRYRGIYLMPVFEERIMDGVDLAVYSSDGARIGLVAGDCFGSVVAEHSIVVWDVHPAFFLKSMSISQDDSVTAIVLSSSGRYCFIESEKKGLAVWNINTGLVYSGRYRAAPSGQDGKQIVIETDCSGDNRIPLTIEEYRSLIGGNISPDGERIAEYSDSMIKIKDLHTRRVLNNIIHGTSCYVLKIEWSPTGNHIIAWSSYGDLKVWNPKTRELVMVLTGHNNDIYSVKYSPDGKMVIAASGKTIVCWDAETGNIRWRNTDFNTEVFALAFSCDSKYVLATTVELEKGFVVCDSVTGKIVVAYRGVAKPYTAIAFSQNGRNIVTAGSDGRIILWDFPHLQDLIDKSRERLKERQLTYEERKMYYLE